MQDDEGSDTGVQDIVGACNLYSNFATVQSRQAVEKPCTVTGRDRLGASKSRSPACSTAGANDVRLTCYPGPVLNLDILLSAQSHKVLCRGAFGPYML